MEENRRFSRKRQLTRDTKKKNGKGKGRKENAIPSLAARSVRLLTGPLGLLTSVKNR